MTCVDLPPGTVLVPQYQTNKVQTEEATTNDGKKVSGESVPGDATSRAVNFLKTSDGNFIVKKTTFHISDTVAKKMSVECRQNRSSSRGTMWIDGGTNVSAMGSAFRMLEYSGRMADMTGFANDIVKRDVPIGSGVTKCVTDNGMEFLLGLHESPYLKHNAGCLLSTHQAREAGIWLCDTLKRHGDQQRLVAPIENSDELVDIKLILNNGLLSI